MSNSRAWSWRHEIARSDLPAETRHVLLTLSLFMNEMGEGCFPSVAELATATGRDRKTVMKHLDTAREAGWIAVSQLGLRGRKWRRSEYKARWPERDLVATPCAHGADEQGGVTDGPPHHANEVVETVPQGGGNDTLKVVEQVDRVIDQSKDSSNTSPVERERADARAPETGEGDQPDRSTSGGATSGNEAEERKKRWAVFWRKWENSTIDDRDAALRAWGDVPFDQLQSAIDGVKPYFAEHKRKGRKPLAAAKYLRQAKWEGLLRPDVANVQVKVLGPWTKAWIAVLVDMLEAGNARAAQSMVRFAQKGHGRSVHPNRPKTAELLKRAEGYRLIPAHHDGWMLFAMWVERRSTDLEWRVVLPDLPSTDDKPFFVAVPPDDVCRSLGIQTNAPASKPPTDDEVADAFS